MGHTKHFGPHPLTWKTPTPPEDIRTLKFEFMLLFVAELWRRRRVIRAKRGLANRGGWRKQCSHAVVSGPFSSLSLPFKKPRRGTHFWRSIILGVVLILSLANSLPATPFANPGNSGGKSVRIVTWKTDFYTVVVRILLKSLLQNFQPPPQWCLKCSSHGPRNAKHHWCWGGVKQSVCANFPSSSGGA